MTVSLVAGQAHSSTSMTSNYAANPTSGNLGICIQFHWSNSPTAASGWTQLFNANGSTGDGYAVYYKYFGAGESKNQVVGTQGTASMAHYFELTGVTGTIGTDLPFSHKEFDKAASPTYNSTSFNTGQVNTLIVGAFSGCVNTSTTETAISSLTGGSSITVAASVIDNVGPSRRSTGESFSDFIAGSGTAYAIAATFSNNQLVLARSAILEFANGTPSGTNITSTVASTWGGWSEDVEANTFNDVAITETWGGWADAETGSVIPTQKVRSFSPSGI